MNEMFVAMRSEDTTTLVLGALESAGGEGGASAEVESSARGTTMGLSEAPALLEPPSFLIVRQLVVDGAGEREALAVLEPIRLETLGTLQRIGEFKAQRFFTLTAVQPVGELTTLGERETQGPWQAGDG